MICRVKSLQSTSFFMATDHSKEPKCSCLECKREYYTIYFEKHFKTCKARIRRLDTNRVECPICGERVKEINTSHLRLHGTTVPEFKIKFPDASTMSEATRQRKATLANLTPEHSFALKYGHTLQAKIEKWGEKEGRRRHEESKNKYAVAKSLRGYIERLGEEGGRRAWCKMCSRKSVSGSKIPFPLREPFRNYKILVNRVTNINLKLYGKTILGEKPKGHHTDHKFSQLQGFLDGVSPYLIGFVGNLQFISASENCSKQNKCSISLDTISSGIETYPDYKNIVENDLLKINDRVNEILNQVNNPPP